MNSQPIEEICALKSKVYSIQVADHLLDKKVAKGVASVALKKRITHDDYLRVLRSNDVVRAEALTIRSERHQIYTMAIGKRALDAVDSKRVVLNDGISTLPFGHYQLNDPVWCRNNLWRDKEDGEGNEDDAMSLD